MSWTELCGLIIINCVGLLIAASSDETERSTSTLWVFLSLYKFSKVPISMWNHVVSIEDTQNSHFILIRQVWQQLKPNKHKISVYVYQLQTWPLNEAVHGILTLGVIKKYWEVFGRHAVSTTSSNTLLSLLGSMPWKKN